MILGPIFTCKSSPQFTNLEWSPYGHFLLLNLREHCERQDKTSFSHPSYYSCEPWRGTSMLCCHFVSTGLFAKGWQLSFKVGIVMLFYKLFTDSNGLIILRFAFTLKHWTQICKPDCSYTRHAYQSNPVAASKSCCYIQVSSSLFYYLFMPVAAIWDIYLLFK